MRRSKTLIAVLVLVLLSSVFFGCEMLNPTEDDTSGNGSANDGPTGIVGVWKGEDLALNLWDDVPAEYVDTPIDLQVTFYENMTCEILWQDPDSGEILEEISQRGTYSNDPAEGFVVTHCRKSYTDVEWRFREPALYAFLDYEISATQLALDLNYGPETATDSFDDTGVELAYLGEPGQPFGEPNASTTLSLPSGVDYADIGAAGKFVEVFLFPEDDPDAVPLVWLGHWPEQNEAVAHLIVPPAAYEVSACLFVNGSIYNDEAPGPTILQGDYAGYYDSGTPTTISEEGTTQMEIVLEELEEDL